MAKQKTTANRKEAPSIGREGARLTSEQAKRMIMDNWIDRLAEDESACDFLLLLYTIAGIEGDSERETFVIEIESLLMPFAPSMGEAMTELLRRRLSVAYLPTKEGGTQ